MSSFSDGCAAAHVKFSNDASLMESSGRVGREREKPFLVLRTCAVPHLLGHGSGFSDSVMNVICQ